MMTRAEAIVVEVDLLIEDEEIKRLEEVSLDSTKMVPVDPVITSR